MKLYKTGEFASMANLSLRTIRYYDEIGLLKPTRVLDNGYRMYSDQDFLKLQKIITLKNLGFSLEDIFSMTLNESYMSLNETLVLRKKMIDARIKQLEAMKDAINKTQQSIASEEDINWPEILHDLEFASMENELVEQYKNATNVDIRIRLHELYSQNKTHWFEWLFDQYVIKPGMRILEIGCGNGELWVKNHDRLPECDIVLSDISEGMLSDAYERLGDGYEYVKCDGSSLPFEDASFDIVIANHVFFYVKDLENCLNEVHRVLKKNGILYASAYGKKHMKEITDLVKEFNSSISLSNINLYDQFGLDNGKDILKKVFKHIDLVQYIDALEVTDADDLIHYILSCHGNQAVYISKNYPSFHSFVENKVKQSFHITKDAGIFKCFK